MPKPIPKPSVLDAFEFLGAINGVRRWRSDDGKRLYTWDSLHGEIEVFNARGKHLGTMDPKTGRMTKAAVRGRTIDV
jgi:Cytotoxic